MNPTRIQKLDCNSHRNMITAYNKTVASLGDARGEGSRPPTVTPSMWLNL